MQVSHWILKIFLRIKNHQTIYFSKKPEEIQISTRNWKLKISTRNSPRKIIIQTQLSKNENFNSKTLRKIIEKFDPKHRKKMKISLETIGRNFRVVKHTKESRKFRLEIHWSWTWISIYSQFQTGFLSH